MDGDKEILNLDQQILEEADSVSDKNIKIQGEEEQDIVKQSSDINQQQSSDVNQNQSSDVNQHQNSSEEDTTEDKKTNLEHSSDSRSTTNNEEILTAEKKILSEEKDLIKKSSQNTEEELLAAESGQSEPIANKESILAQDISKQIEENRTIDTNKNSVDVSKDKASNEKENLSPVDKPSEEAQFSETTKKETVSLISDPDNIILVKNQKDKEKIAIEENSKVNTEGSLIGEASSAEAVAKTKKDLELDQVKNYITESQDNLEISEDHNQQSDLFQTTNPISESQIEEATALNSTYSEKNKETTKADTKEDSLIDQSVKKTDSVELDSISATEEQVKISPSTTQEMAEGKGNENIENPEESSSQDQTVENSTENMVVLNQEEADNSENKPESSGIDAESVPDSITSKADELKEMIATPQANENDAPITLDTSNQNKEEAEPSTGDNNGNKIQSEKISTKMSTNGEETAEKQRESQNGNPAQSNVVGEEQVGYNQSDNQEVGKLDEKTNSETNGSLDMNPEDTDTKG